MSSWDSLGREGQLYMSHLAPYMDDQFLFRAFGYFSEVPKQIKVVNKYGDGTGYAFVHFNNEKSAVACLHKLNGKTVPHSNPPIKFRLHHSSERDRNASNPGKEYSVWVGDLSTDVDDYQLYKAFSGKYHTIRLAKVVVDNNGHSKGYGFIKFNNEDEQKHCLSHMNGYIGLGSKAVRVSSAVPKGVRLSSSSTLSTPTSNKSPVSDSAPEDYWKNYAAWSKKYYDPVAMAHHTVKMNVALLSTSSPSISRSNELELIDHTQNFDVNLSNRELIEQDFCFWDALEASKWLPVEQIDD